MFCEECGHEIKDNAVICVNCGCEIKKNIQSSSVSTRMLVPVDRSGMAIAAGYLALFSVLGVFAPLALLCGILGLKDIKNNPDKHGKGRCWFGIIMGTIFSIIMILILIPRLS